MSERSTKKQRELLTFVDGFIKEHGYGPSYREIMNGMGYKSVSTVAIHIDGLISKGYLRKRDNSARSLEVVSAEFGGDGFAGGATAGGGAGGVGDSGAGAGAGSGAAGSAAKEKWLVGVIEGRFVQYEKTPQSKVLDEIYVLVGALKVLGFNTAYEAMRAKLARAIARQ